MTLILFATGCVERQLTVKSDPSGALVFLNGDEIGRTPVTRNFTWYGTYDVELRKEGYQALKTRGKVIAPWWQWPPFDLLAELFPLTDRTHLSYHLKPLSDVQEDPSAMVERGEKMRGMLQSSRHTATRIPYSKPATAPGTVPSTAPTTAPSSSPGTSP